MCRHKRPGGTEGSNPVPSSGESNANILPRYGQDLKRPSERLMRLLTALGQDVKITLWVKPPDRVNDRFCVLGEARA
jgi:hypothetical protein